MRTEFYNGYLFQIEYKRELSNWDYTQHHVYHIKTDDDSSEHVYEAVKSIIADQSWSKEERDKKYAEQPSIFVALHDYHTFKFDKNLNCYVYTLVRPYDD